MGRGRHIEADNKEFMMAVLSVGFCASRGWEGYKSIKSGFDDHGKHSI